MERLTEKHYLGTDHYMKCSGNCNVDMDCIDCPSFDCLVERLAAYEDTWLEPEEITAMQQTLDEYHKVVAAAWNLLWAIEMEIVHPECVDTPWRAADGE